MSSDEATTSNFSQIYQIYGNVHNNYNNSSYSYAEIDTNYDIKYVPNLVDIGPLCNDEYSYNNLSYTQMWKTPDTLKMCLQNAEKVINDAVWTDENNLRNGSYTVQKGLNFIQMSANNYIDGDVNFFIKNQSVSPLSNAIITINAGNAVEVFGYFVPDVSGLWTFTIPQASVDNKIFSKLWISNNNALYDYTNENADINNNKQLKNGNGNSFSIQLTQGDCVPIRVHIVTQNVTLPNIPVLIVNKPDRTTIIPGKSGSPPNFITITNKGKLYLKTSLYVALVSNSANLYSCYFLDPSSESNLPLFYSLKLNPKLQHIKTQIPTAVTYAGKGTSSQAKGTDTTIALPTGIPLNIDSATYGSTVPYTYSVTTPYTVTSQSWVPETQPSGQSTNVYNGQQQISTYTTGYTQTTQSTQYKTTQKSEAQQKDVTGIAQNAVNRNVLNIPGNQYDAKFGNPIQDNKTNPQFIANYSYSQSVTDVTDKQIYVDPKSGKLVIGYSYQGNPNSTPMPMDQDNTPKSDSYNYRIVLGKDATLQVQDANGTIISKKNLSKFVDPKYKFDLSKCVVNPKWVQNPLATNMIEMGKKMPKDVQELVSSDGRFKLLFFNGNLIFDYCATPYSVVTEGVNKYNYTTVLNVENDAQMFYLYRINSRGLHGKKFLGEFLNSTKNIYYLPNTHNNILKNSGYSQPVTGDVYPYITPNNNNVNYNVTLNSNNADCKSKCDSEVKCEHYFLTKDSTGKQTCYTDITSNANPLYFSVPSNIKSSTFNKKTYKINTACGEVVNNMDMLYGIDKPDYVVNYFPGENAQNLTYYCASKPYQEANSKIFNLIKNETFQNYREGMSIEQTIKSNIETKITPAANTYAGLQDNINDEYNKKMRLLNSYTDLSNNLASQKYLFNSSESIIPDLYVNRPNEKTPLITLDDGLKRDTQVMLLEQNRMFTLASISAVSFLILAVFLARD
jgi:hypothetical protein